MVFPADSNEIPECVCVADGFLPLDEKANGDSVMDVKSPSRLIVMCFLRNTADSTPPSVPLQGTTSLSVPFSLVEGIGSDVQVFTPASG